MVNDPQKKAAEKIRSAYAPKDVQESKFDQLKGLDRKVRRPAEIFAWVFGVIGTLVLGAGMCLAMEVIGSLMPLGIAVGVVGIAMALVLNFGPTVISGIITATADGAAAETVMLLGNGLAGF